MRMIVEPWMNSFLEMDCLISVVKLLFVMDMSSLKNISMYFFVEEYWSVIHPIISIGINGLGYGLGISHVNSASLFKGTAIMIWYGEIDLKLKGGEGILDGDGDGDGEEGRWIGNRGYL